MSDRAKGLPGLRGTDHIGFTVPNLQEAITFFVDVIGCEPFYELGPFQSDSDWMQTHLNVHPRAVMKKLNSCVVIMAPTSRYSNMKRPTRTPPRRRTVMWAVTILPFMWTTWTLPWPT